MHAIVFIEVSWTHRQLAWSPADYEGIESILVDTCSMWTPSILIYLGVGESIELKFADTLRVTYQGAVSSDKNYHLSFSCVIDFDKYPFDTQLCPLGFYPSARPTARLELLQTSYSIYNSINFSGEWNLKKLHHSEIAVANLLLPLAKYPNYLFELERKSAYYVITIIFPMVLTSAMIPLVFVIPTKTGEKISYLVAIFTSTAIFLNYIW
ncbi:unnamed protein product [Lymnaea stagnalis]|uniref:Neurotransmitter-gated ion-channel ligand-binding domain-containing protein n=1 Tax=Lymnaea stagnalis TaxID=6523 RepID=A0AAV2IMV0_LYMST